MGLYTDPPSLRDFKYDKPSLLVCWWITIFCTIIIALRVVGRFIRTERLFREDRIAALALLPLYARMALIHYTFIYGTNNADFTDVDLSDQQIREKQIASGLVLGAHLFYAATLWTLKYTVLEFLKRLTELTWNSSYERGLIFIRWSLIVTFCAVIISDFAECHPFDHYWQVLPDPGGQCRQSFAQLLTMGICNGITELMLIIFPIPLIFRSNMRMKRKLQLLLLFSLSLSVVGMTCYRLPHVIWAEGRQQTKSLLASVELLFATASANALVLGSFVRDRGIKKTKFRRASAADSFEHRGSNARRPTLHRHWGSDEDLVRDVGLSVKPDLREAAQKDLDPGTLAPAPKVSQSGYERWQMPQRAPSSAERSDSSLLPHDRENTELQTGTKKLSFFDVGGLLEDSLGSSSDSFRRRESNTSNIDPLQPNPMPSASLTSGSGSTRRGSSALLHDIGGLLGPTPPKAFRTKQNRGTELKPISQSHGEPQTYNMHGKPDPVLQDPGGLLS